MNTKAIYMPKGKAGEYAKYACNFYVGCSNDCTYCYCKRGVLAHAMGKAKATLKKCFKDERDALRIFRSELQKYLPDLRKHGLFFTFTSDPLLKETRQLTFDAVSYAVSYGVPCKILTKRADFIDHIPGEWFVHDWYKTRIAFGFTLTGHDELEPGASPTLKRIEAMRTLHNYGFKTFASIEPIISLKETAEIIGQTTDICNLYKIGLLTGQKNYTPREVKLFMISLYAALLTGEAISNMFDKKLGFKVYLKDSMFEYTKLNRETFENGEPVFVSKDYNLFH